MLKCLSGSRLKRVDVENNVRKAKYCFMVASTEKVGKRLRKEKKADILSKFEKNFRKAYINTAAYMQKKLPLTKRALMSLSGLDPSLLKHSTSYNLLKTLSEFFSAEDCEAYLKEISDVQLDENLPSTLTTNGGPVRLDHWWNQVFKSNKYPALSKIVKACLSIFSGPQVESSFSKMNDLIDKKANRMDSATYDTIMTVKYVLQSKTSDIYRRGNPLYDSTNKNTYCYCRTSNSRYKKKMSEKRKKQEIVLRTIGAKVNILHSNFGISFFSCYVYYNDIFLRNQECRRLKTSY